MKVSARSAGGQVCILHLARFNDFPGAKIVAIEPVQKTKPREKMVYFSLTAKLEWLTLVRPAATARAHSRSRNAFGEETLTSCLTRVGGPEIRLGSTWECLGGIYPKVSAVPHGPFFSLRLAESGRSPKVEAVALFEDMIVGELGLVDNAIKSIAGCF